MMNWQIYFHDDDDDTDVLWSGGDSSLVANCADVFSQQSHKPGIQCKGNTFVFVMQYNICNANQYNIEFNDINAKQYYDINAI